MRIKAGFFRSVNNDNVLLIPGHIEASIFTEFSHLFQRVGWLVYNGENDKVIWPKNQYHLPDPCRDLVDLKRMNDES